MQLNVHPFETIEEARVWARGLIDEAAGAARSRYLTISPGQDATYSAKYQDALAYQRAGYAPADGTGFPWVKAEAGATNVTVKAAADRILDIGNAWNSLLGPTIEGYRVGGKDLITAETTIQAVLLQANN